jgi:hypothetical protein
MLGFYFKEAGTKDKLVKEDIDRLAGNFYLNTIGLASFNMTRYFLGA